ncbi:MAG TPA: serine/threonine-protein kinase, partial [Pyrinomonadaceae bacterium]|nr:serine/threonine-protein kinase [Pyrinomonadaceae bacterium]
MSCFNPVISIKLAARDATRLFDFNVFHLQTSPVEYNRRPHLFCRIVVMDQSSQIIDGRYRVVRQLGQGSFGTTLLAEDTMLSRRVVVKVAHDTERDSNATASITREAKAFASFHHPNVARLLDFGALHDGRAYLVVEWVDGTSLRDILAGGTMSLSFALAVLQALAEALAAAHAGGIIHRDIKPSNVIVPHSEAGPLYGQAKLIDFGAFGRIRRSTGTTQTGEIYGTVYYMSPEQLLGQPQSTATDVYGLGVLLYEMLTGTTPFTGDEVPKVFSKIIGEAPAIPQSLPAEVRTLLERWLSKDPKARPASAAAALVEIREASELMLSSSAAMVGSLPGNDVAGTAYRPAPPPAPQAYPSPPPPIAAAPPVSWADTTVSVKADAPKTSGRS